MRITLAALKILFVLILSTSCSRSEGPGIGSRSRELIKVVVANMETLLVAQTTGTCSDYSLKKRFLIGGNGFVNASENRVSFSVSGMIDENKGYKVIVRYYLDDQLTGAPTQIEGTYDLDIGHAKIDLKDFADGYIELGSNRVQITLKMYNQALPDLVGQTFGLRTIWSNTDLLTQIPLCP